MAAFAVPMIVASLLTGAPSSGEDKSAVKFETILKAFDGGPEKPLKAVVQSQKEWDAFIDKCSSEATRTRLREKKVDFAKETLLVVAVGPNSSILGHADYEKQAGVQRIRQTEDGLVVEYVNVFSDHRDTKNRFPLHVVKVAKAKAATFKGDTKFFGG